MAAKAWLNRTMMAMDDIAAIILAAGASSRYRAAAGPDGPSTKLVARHEGEALVRRVARAALAAKARPVVVVTGHARADVETALAGLPVAFVHNADFATGLASSLKAGVAALPAAARGAVVLLGDMPFIEAGVIDLLIEGFAKSPAASAVAPLHKGERGNPVLIARALFSRVAELKGDTGARALLNAGGDSVVDIETGDAAVTFDVDTPDALQAGNQAAPASGSDGSSSSP